MLRGQLFSLICLPSVLGIATRQNTETGNATAISGNPPGTAFRAVFPTDKQFTPTPNGNIRGVVRAQSASDGKGVRFEVKIENLPLEGGPFLYHIHNNAVVEGNCTTAGTHLDPFNKGEKTPCNANLPTTCQVGDLAGKFGAITTNPGFEASYTDIFTATEPGSAYIGNRSIVIHYANRTRITCANFKKD